MALVEPKCQQAKRWWKFYVCETALVTKEAKNNKLPKEELAKILAKKRKMTLQQLQLKLKLRKTQSICSDVADNVHYSIQLDWTSNRSNIPSNIRVIGQANKEVIDVWFAPRFSQRTPRFLKSTIAMSTLVHFFFLAFDQHMLSTSEFDSSKLFEKQAILLSSQR